MDILPPSPTSVYRYYDKYGILIYVGITSRGMQRNREHNSTKDWWTLVASQEVEHFETRIQAEARERSLIECHMPPFNKQHNRDAALSRSAYFTFLAGEAVKIPLREAIATLPEKRIWLDRHPGPTMQLILRTRPEDAQLARALTLPEPVRAYGFGKPTRILKLEHVGPFALLYVNKNVRELKDAHAVVRSDPKDPDRVAHLRVVQVRLERTMASLAARDYSRKAV